MKNILSNSSIWELNHSNYFRKTELWALFSNHIHYIDQLLLTQQRIIPVLIQETSGFQAGPSHADFPHLLDTPPRILIPTKNAQAHLNPHPSQTLPGHMHCWSWAREFAVQFWISPSLSSLISAYTESWLRAAPCPHHLKKRSLRMPLNPPISMCSVQTFKSPQVSKCPNMASQTIHLHPHSHIFLKHIKLSPASGPLQLLLILPGMLFPRCNRAVPLTFRCCMWPPPSLPLTSPCLTFLRSYLKLSRFI